jgi:hypothetical protein
LTCPICGSHTDYFRQAHGGKICYFDCHRRWLPQNHIFGQQKNAFKKDTIITKGPSKHLSGPEIADMIDKLVPYPTKPGYFKGYGEVHNWTHICGQELPYVSMLILTQNINVMLQVCNIGESNISACMDLQSKSKRQHKGSKGLGRAL